MRTCMVGCVSFWVVSAFLCLWHRKTVPVLPLLLCFLSEAATEAVLESKCVFKLLKAMKTFPKTRSLQWKVSEAVGVAAYNGIPPEKSRVSSRSR